MNDIAAPKVSRAGCRLREEIKRLRIERGLSQPSLAALTGYSRQYVSRAERSHNLPSHDLVRSLDMALGADGGLLSLWIDAKEEQKARRHTALPIWASGIQFGAVATEGFSGGSILRTPAGRFFSGSVTPLLSAPAVCDGERVLLKVEGISGEWLSVPRRGMVVATADTAEGTRLYGLDRRRVRSSMGKAGMGAPLLVPRAYELDEFAFGILWAVTNLDDALLDDDRELHSIAKSTGTSRTCSGFRAAADPAGELSAVSRMWLGSNVCAHHVLSNLTQLAGVPVYWSREQRGEEASTWLFFAHKYDYLRHTSALARSAGAVPTRTFCVPGQGVEESSGYERVLFLLAAALNEALGVRVAVCTEAEYTAVHGFVLDRGHRAIVATWVNTDRLWHIDVTDGHPTLREFGDAIGWADSRSILAAATPEDRLRGLAEYLRLDLPWVVRRARELGDHGVGGLIQPRSRLLSLSGLEHACRFLGAVGISGR
ncbi:helix-turn-helix transcriptional regulator [Nocardia sp. NPDC004068]|uniref:helix-turn-helix transcriptional regulator n=1 Tax=Nocardia sp. NPDC004068 TaxID=3364303 RepID=UPI00367BC8AD